MRPELTALLADAAARLPDPTSFVAVDFETYYISEKKAKKAGVSACTVELGGNWGYCRHPDWEAYMVSIYSPDVQFVGRPEDAPWEKIKGRVWLSHNRNFDKHVFERLVELGRIKL